MLINAGTAGAVQPQVMHSVINETQAHSWTLATIMQMIPTDWSNYLCPSTVIG